jgi:tetratricopeptide (TPR) repeat protein
LPAGADDFPTLRSLNASRELWKQRFAIPVIFWLPEYAAGLLSIHAPDCWRWFSHQFEFVSELAGVEAGRSDQYAGDTLAAGRLDADQKRFRMAELQQRIDQAGPEPDPQIVSHVLLWLNELAFLHQFLGDLDRAEEMLRKSLEIGKKLGRLAGMAIDYGNLGLIHRKRGDLARAEEMHRKALEIDEKLGRQEGMANTYGNLGSVAKQRGDIAQVRQLWSKSRELFEQIGMPHMVERVQGQLDKLPKETGD